MREISPAHNTTVEQFLALMPEEFKKIIESIRQQKVSGTRPLPSTMMLDSSNLLDEGLRKALLDKVAQLVDENLAGRSEMCEQFAILLAKALIKMGFPANAVVGEAIYYDDHNQKIFSWRHAWVRIGDEVIDGNVDILNENPVIPKSVKVNPYWGPVRNVPKDRHLRQDHSSTVSDDTDVNNIWWPELDLWLSEYLKNL